ncbi:MAG: ATP-binding protein [Endomicrobiales bacterium]|jgi:two-component system NtrC family sensor kinase
MVDINIQTVLEMLSELIGVEGAETLINTSVSEANLKRQLYYSEQEFQSICDRLASRGGSLEMFSALIVTSEYREKQYQRIIDRERNEKEKITSLYAQMERLNEELKEKRFMIEDYARNLENKVKERTQDLELANENLKNAQDQLIQSEKMASIGTIAAGVAHEINTPLGAILINTQLLLREIKNFDQKECLTTIEEATRRCKIIVSTLLGFTRKSAALDTQKMLMSDAINEACKIIVTELVPLNIKIEKVFNDKQSEVLANSTEIIQVFTNLILNAKNAIEKTQRKDGLIKLEITEDDVSVYATVIDNGCGIDEKNHRRIFDPFYTTQDVGKGTGLGLAISKQIVAKHYGKLDFTSQLNVGTTFTVSLPKRKQQ